MRRQQQQAGRETERETCEKAWPSNESVVVGMATRVVSTAPGQKVVGGLRRTGVLHSGHVKVRCRVARAAGGVVKVVVVMAFQHRLKLIMVMMIPVAGHNCGCREKQIRLAELATAALLLLQLEEVKLVLGALSKHFPDRQTHHG